MNGFNWLATNGLTLFVILFALGLFRIVYVLGQWGAARMTGVRVCELALGCGPVLWGCKRGATDYNLRLFPFWGFTRLDCGTGPGCDPGDPGSLLNKHFASQAAVLGGGALIILVLSFLLFVFVGFVGGIPSIVPASVAVVAKVHAGSPAADAGFLPGDRILAVDGRVVDRWSDLLANVVPNPGKRLAVKVVRAGQEQMLEVVPREIMTGDGRKIGQIGIQNATLLTVRFLPATGASEVLREAASWFGRIMVLPAVIAYRMLCGEMDAKTLVQGAAGPLLVIQMFYEVSRQGAWAMLFFWACLGASMGMWLLVPLPGLDGGRLLMVGIGAVAGRPLEPPLGGTVHKAGLVLWLLLMLALTLRDVPRLLAGVRFFSLLVGQGWGP